MSGALDPELLAEARRVQLRADRMVTDVMSGGYSSVFRGSGIEFDEVREFAEGDELRSVDWNVTARVGRPFVKKFVEERELTVLFLLDASSSMGFGTKPPERSQESRTAAATAALFVGCVAIAVVALVAFGGFILLMVSLSETVTESYERRRTAMVGEWGIGLEGGRRSAETLTGASALVDGDADLPKLPGEHPAVHRDPLGQRGVRRLPSLAHGFGPANVLRRGGRRRLEPP